MTREETSRRASQKRQKIQKRQRRDHKASVTNHLDPGGLPLENDVDDKAGKDPHETNPEACQLSEVTPRLRLPSVKREALCTFSMNTESSFVVSTVEPVRFRPRVSSRKDADTLAKIQALWH